MAKIYFGGLHDDLPLSYSGDTDLDALGPEGFRVAFLEWLTQCWIYDNEVPNDSASLKRFDLDSLISQFPSKFKSGDWKRMRAGRGASLEEYLLYLQLVNQEPLALVLNKDQPEQPLKRIRHILKLSDFEIGGCLLSIMGNLREVQSPAEIGFPILLFDGRTGHIITVRSLDDSGEWVSYEDPTWPGGKSMLCKGENQAGIEAYYLGETDVGQWVVSGILLPRVIYAIPVPVRELQVWKRCARDLDELLKNW